jgi:hypothetical protein
MFVRTDGQLVKRIDDAMAENRMLHEQKQKKKREKNNQKTQPLHPS